MIGNPAMAVGGTGDVLTGIVAAFLSWCEPFKAASVAVFVNCLAGDLAVKQFGNRVTATDILKYIPKVLRKFDKLHISNYSERLIDYLGL